MFPVRYKLNVEITFARASGFKALLTCQQHMTHVENIHRAIKMFRNEISLGHQEIC
jgi:hypothetical protein